MSDAGQIFALSVVDVAVLLDCHPETVRRLIRRGELRAVRVGRLIRVPREAVTEFLARAYPPESFYGKP